MASSPDIATLSLGDFEPHLDAVFEMQTPGGVVPLKLARRGDSVGVAWPSWWRRCCSAAQCHGR
jgi:hypothetical protein